MGYSILSKLVALISDRKNNPKDGSYTNFLMQGGDNLIIKKLGEENAEYLLAFLTQSKDRIASEAADYLYHLMVSLEYKGVDFELVLKELRQRYDK